MTLGSWTEEFQDSIAWQWLPPSPPRLYTEEDPMSTPDTTTAAVANSRPSSADALPDYAPVPRSALGPALNDQGYAVGRVERNLYWVTDGTYQAAFLITPDGVVLFDAPPTIGHNLQRAIDEVAAANGVSNRVYTLFLHDALPI